MLERIAEEYARKYHKGQYRKDGTTPYITHPTNVVNLLKEHGFDDGKTLTSGWLHDALEDTDLKYNEIRRVFGKEVAEGIRILTRNVDREAYKRRLSSAPINVRLIKLCDTLDNIRTLNELNSEEIERKVKDCETYYIPLASEICPPIAVEMEKIISNYLVRAK